LDDGGIDVTEKERYTGRFEGIDAEGRAVGYTPADKPRVVAVRGKREAQARRIGGALLSGARKVGAAAGRAAVSGARMAAREARKASARKRSAPRRESGPDFSLGGGMAERQLRGGPFALTAMDGPRRRSRARKKGSKKHGRARRNKRDDWFSL
jgi:hypothetical protein